MSTTNWIIAVVIVAILGVGAYYVFDNGPDNGMHMTDEQMHNMPVNPNATGTDMMMSSSSDSMDHGDMMNASGTVKVNVY